MKPLDRDITTEEDLELRQAISSAQSLIKFFLEAAKKAKWKLALGLIAFCSLMIVFDNIKHLILSSPYTIGAALGIGLTFALIGDRIDKRIEEKDRNRLSS